MSWRLEQQEFLNRAVNGHTEVYLDRDGDPAALEIMAEQGSGYCREAINTCIPMEVLIKLMEHAGYKVTR